MGALIVSLGGGGGASSDECTATANDILKGTRTINRNSDDEIVEGTLELTGNASTGHVLKDETFYTTDAHTKQTGTMPNNTGRSTNGNVPGISSSYSQIPTREGTNLQMQTDTSGTSRISIAVPAGYYDGGGYINRPSSDFGTTSVDNVLSGATFTSTAGIKKSGTMPNRGAWGSSVGVNGSVTIPAGYHNGSGKVTNSVSTMGGGTYTPSGSAQTIYCSGKYMTENITFNAIPSNYVVPSVGAAFFSGGSYGVLAGGLGAYYVRSSGNQYLSSLSGLQAIISDNVEDQSIVFRTCVDVTHFKRFVANVTINSISRNKSLWFFLSQETGIAYKPGRSYYSACGIIGTYDIVINAPSDINTAKKWCIGFRPSGTSVINFSINSIYAYAN